MGSSLKKLKAGSVAELKKKILAGFIGGNALKKQTSGAQNHHLDICSYLENKVK